ETAPGEQMQADFTVVRRGRAPLLAFVATLGYSRASFVRFTTDETADTSAPTGIAQMLGNVWEWTTSTFGPYPDSSAGSYANYLASAARNRFASACRSFQPMAPFPSTSGRNSQYVSP
ncbi:MAG: SUMF1/EgtB/PvdO family nonheme iron enzyme, partial [Betaproteobacteria bacterium]|nr:SUMF1/EgtB/PvdO family nonheme iron enzyme [Betaproteobacteria bacterium]